MIRLMAKSVRLITLGKEVDFSKERKSPDKTWLVDVPQKVDIRMLGKTIMDGVTIVENLINWFSQRA